MSYTVIANTDENNRSLAKIGGQSEDACKGQCNSRDNCVGAVRYGDGTCWPVWADDAKYGRGGSTFLSRPTTTADPAAPSGPLANYVKYERKVSPGGDLSLHKWVSPEVLALYCNQMDNCNHIVVRRDGRAPVNGVTGGGWLRTAQNFFNHGDYNVYVKKNAVPKVDAPKPGQISVLDNPTTKIRSFDGGNFDATEWQHGRGYYNCNTFGNGIDKIASMRIPLGYQVSFQQHCLPDTGKEGTGNGPGILVGPQNIDSGKLASWGVLDSISSMVVEQVPFDVNARFNDMSDPGNGVTDTDAKRIKTNFCSQKGFIDEARCKSFLDNTAQSGSTWNIVKMGVCAGYDWGADPSCVNAVNQVFKTGQAGEQSTAANLVNSYCNDKSKRACACVNATKRTIDQCLAEPATPGCDTIATKVGKYKTLGAQFLTAQLKPFCASDECQNASTSTEGKYLSQPGPIGGCNDKINACFQQISVGQMSGGNLAVGCQIQDINPPPPAPNAPPPPPPAVPPPPPGTRPPGAPPPSTPAGTPIAPGSTQPPSSSTDLLWPKDLVPGLDTKDKQLGGFGILCLCFLCCCALVVVLALSGGGGGGGGDRNAMVRMAMARLRG